MIGLGVLFIIGTVWESGAAGQCSFPGFLRTTSADETDRTWITETRYIDNTDLWESQLEVVVEEQQLVAKVKYKVQCHDITGSVPCLQREVAFRRSCIDRVDGKYLVQHTENGQTHYTCLKFVQRNENIVQVWEAPDNAEPHHEMCRDANLRRQEWIWHAPKLIEWTFFPIEGGYDFRTYMFERRRKLCYKTWRPSRMESECVRGEGLEFSFPEKSCSPFYDHKQDVSMQCWGSWIEDDYLYILASEVGKMPQFAMRFPRNTQASLEFTVDMYFSPVAPLDRRGIPSGSRDIRQIELKMKRGEGGLCYDESKACEGFEEEGKCTQNALHQYANYCKRSCGLCNLLPSTRAECVFPGEFQRDWYLFERDRQETVKVQGGLITFSSLGDFICKSKHWNLNNYKLMSYYQNGCRPRYTCLHIEQTGDNTLRYQISRSARNDQSFRLCHFKDDPEPLGGLIRSAQMKTLLPVSLTRLSHCGLEGVAHVNVTLQGGRRCQGTLSDWDDHTCTTRPVLDMHLPRCAGGGQDYHTEFMCTAYVNMYDGQSLLFTTPHRGGTYSCWIIRTYPERMSYKPWREAHMLYRAQCGTDEDMDPAVNHVTAISAWTNSEKVVKPCPRKMVPGYPAGFSTPKSVMAKEIRATQTGNGSGGNPSSRASISVAASSAYFSNYRTLLLLCLCLFPLLSSDLCSPS